MLRNAAANHLRCRRHWSPYGMILMAKSKPILREISGARYACRAADNVLRDEGETRPIRVYATPFFEQVLRGFHRTKDDSRPAEKLHVHDITYKTGTKQSIPQAFLRDKPCVLANSKNFLC